MSEFESTCCGIPCIIRVRELVQDAKGVVL